jgi:hypothetical protein
MQALTMIGSENWLAMSHGSSIIRRFFGCDAYAN